MAQIDLDVARQRLLEERQRLETDIYERTEGDEAVLPVDPLNDSGGMASDQADDADAMTDSERNQAILRNTVALLEQVNAALGRLDAGSYGVCMRCGREIPARRLERLPYATYDVDCQAIIESEQQRAAHMSAPSFE